MTNTSPSAESTINKRSSSMIMLWIAMGSMAMMFAGLTSAYIISRDRKDWLSFEVPIEFYFSTIVIILCSIALHFMKKNVTTENYKLADIFISVAFGLGILFVYFQFSGFNTLIEKKLYFTGKGSTISSSFLYIITALHLLHVAAGLLVLMVLLIKQFLRKYSPSKILGLTLGISFWHFLDILWIYLIIFISIMN